MAKEAPAWTIATITSLEGDDQRNEQALVNATEPRAIVEECIPSLLHVEPGEKPELPAHIDAVFVQQFLIAAVVQWHRGEDWRMFIELEPNT